MINSQYTPDTICRALGLGGFANDAQLSQSFLALRLLLTPSFHPEVCLTLRDTGESILLDMVTAQQQIWSQNALSPQPCLTHETTVCLTPADGLRLLETWVYLDPPAPPKWQMIDGMPVHAVLRNRGGIVQRWHTSAHVHAPLDHSIIHTLLHAWRQAPSPALRNSLNHCARYLNCRSLPHCPEPDVKPSLKILTLADDPAVTDALHETLARRHRQPKPS